MSAPIVVMVPEEQRLLGDCLRNAFVGDDRFEVIRTDDGRAEVWTQIERHEPDILLIDKHLPTPAMARLIRGLCQRSPHLKLIVHGLHGTAEEVVALLEAGAHGYVEKDASLSRFKEIIEHVNRGHLPCSAEVAFSMFSRVSELSRRHRHQRVLESLVLSPRELEVLRLVGEMQQNRQIAETLCLSIHTVKNHVHNILRKLGVRSRGEAVEVAYRKGWLSRPTS